MNAIVMRNVMLNVINLTTIILNVIMKSVLLNFIKLSVITLNNAMQNAIMMTVIMLNAIIGEPHLKWYHDECHYGW